MIDSIKLVFDNDSNIHLRVYNMGNAVTYGMKYWIGCEIIDKI